MVDLSSIYSNLNDGISPMYAATKAYNWFLSMAESETKNNNVDFLCVLPGNVDTPLLQGLTKAHKLAVRMNAISTVEECVVGSLKSLGNHNVTYGSTRHEIKGMIFEFLDMMGPLRILNRKAGQFKNFRKMFQKDL